MSYGCMINTLRDLYKSLDVNFKEDIDNTINSDGHASTLLRLLKVWEGEHVNILTPVLQSALVKYETIDKSINCFGFRFGKKKLNITLEDVLYLTGLPIVGKAVITDDNRNTGAFYELFNVNQQRIKMTDFCEIVKDIERPRDTSIIALLLVIIDCYIAPDTSGHAVRTTYVPFVKKLEEVNEYAWGAALLACLYSGMIKEASEDKKIDGNGWVLLGFLLLHIPPLCSTLSIKLNVQPSKVLLTSVIEACKPICNDKKSLRQKADEVFANLAKEDINWQPYAQSMLRTELQDQLQYVTLVSPLFCMDKAVHHPPYLVPKQFNAVFSVQDVDKMRKCLRKIKTKVNKGDNAIKFSKHYKELELWERRTVVGTVVYNSSSNNNNNSNNNNLTHPRHGWDHSGPSKPMETRKQSK